MGYQSPLRISGAPYLPGVRRHGIPQLRPKFAPLLLSESASILPPPSPISDNQTVPASRDPELLNAALLREYLAYLRVEKGLRPLSCEAYQRDLLQFTEFRESENALLTTAVHAHVAGLLEHLGTHGGESRPAARKLSCLRGLYRWLLLD